jgi:hypothetical protein
MEETMTKYIRIEESVFWKLVNAGARQLGANEGGTTYLLRDGRMVASMHNGSNYEYAIVLRRV